MEDEVREGFYRQPRKESTGVVQCVSVNRKLLARFQDGCEKDTTSNQLTNMKVERIPMNKEAEVPTISVITNKTIGLEKGYYYSFYVLQHFKKKDGANRKEYQADMEEQSGEEDIKDVRLNNERDHHWRMVFEDNNKGVEYEKGIPHVKR